MGPTTRPRGAEGLIYAPRYGWVEFAIPHVDEFVRRAFPADG